MRTETLSSENVTTNGVNPLLGNVCFWESTIGTKHYWYKEMLLIIKKRNDDVRIFSKCPDESWAMFKLLNKGGYVKLNSIDEFKSALENAYKLVQLNVA